MRWITWLRVAIADALTGGHGADIPGLSIRFRLPKGWEAIVPETMPWAALVRRAGAASPDAPPPTLERLGEALSFTVARAVDDALGKPRPGDLVVMLAAGLGDDLAAAEDAQRRHSAAHPGRTLERLERIPIADGTGLAVALRDTATGARDLTWARQDGRLWWLVGVRLTDALDVGERAQVALAVLASATHRGGDLDRFSPDAAGRLRLHQARASVQVPAGWRHGMLGGNHRLTPPGDGSASVLVIDDDDDAPAPFGHILYASPPWPDCTAATFGPLQPWRQPGHDGPAWARTIAGERPSGPVLALEAELACPRGWPLLLAVGDRTATQDSLAALLRQVVLTASGRIPARPRAAACVAAANQGLPLTIGRDAARPPPPPPQRAVPAIGSEAAAVITTLAGAPDLRAGLRRAQRVRLPGVAAVNRHPMIGDAVWAVVPLAPGDGSVLLRTQSGPWWTPAEGLGALVDLLPRDRDDGMVLLGAWPEACERLPVARLPPPFPRHGLPAACEDAVSLALMRVSNAQHAFARGRHRPLSDRDEGAFATLAELCGLEAVDPPVGEPLDPAMATAAVAGYRYRIDLPDGDGGALSTRVGGATCPEQGDSWVCYAWPAELPPGSAHQYAIDADLDRRCGPASAEEPAWWALWGSPEAAWRGERVWE